MSTNPSKSYVTRRPQRNGCLGTILALQLVGAALSLLTLPLTYRIIHARAPEKAGLATVLFLMAELILIPSIIALFRWRRWGFYGFLAVRLFVFAVNVWDGGPAAQYVTGLLGVLLVYVALRSGGHSAAWYYLSPGGRADGVAPPPEPPQEGVWPPPPTPPGV